MEGVLIESLKGQGIWTICAVCLTVYVLKTSGEREKKLQDLITKLTDKFNIVENVQNDVKEIKDHIFKK
jgi:hypothetical protein